MLELNHSRKYGRKYFVDTCCYKSILDTNSTMVFRKISKDLKGRALWMWDNDFEVGMIEEVLGITERTLQRWGLNNICELAIM